jgi:hypothetical protein
VKNVTIYAYVLHKGNKTYILFGTSRRKALLTMYEGRLKSSWTHLITPNRNFVEVLRDKKFQSDQRSAARFGEVGGAL